MKSTSSIKLRKLFKKPKGFTIIELLIAMTITLVIVGLLMGMTKMAVSTWQKTHAKTRASKIAQEVFDSVGKDLESMVIRSGNSYEWLLIKESDNTAAEKGPTGGPGVANSKQIVNPLEISFFSAVTDRYNGQINVVNVDKGGDISLVRYRLIHQDIIGSAASQKPVFALYRDRVDPDYTFHHALSQPSIDSNDLTDTPWPGRAGRPVKDYTSAGIVEEKNYLVENIFDFTISFSFEYVLAGQKRYARVQVSADGAQEGLSIKGNSVTDDADQPLVGADGSIIFPAGSSSPRLAGADISILVLSDRGMKGLKNKNITNAAEFSKYLNENGHHYSKSVIVPRP